MALGMGKPAVQFIELAGTHPSPEADLPAVRSSHREHGGGWLLLVGQHAGGFEGSLSKSPVGQVWVII